MGSQGPFLLGIRVPLMVRRDSRVLQTWEILFPSEGWRVMGRKQDFPRLQHPGIPPINQGDPYTQKEWALRTHSRPTRMS